jgi:DNA modification methylase
MATRMKAKPAWRSRIVGQGEVAPAELVPNDRNWRRHPKSQTDALEGALSEVGWVQQVIVNRTTGRMVDGHARVERAIARREPSVPVVYVELDEAEEALVLATLDPIGAMAEADQAALDALLADVSPSDDALRELIAQLGASDARTFQTDPDDIPDFPADITVERGHVYELGKHRLMCGDSTNADDVAVLLAGARPRLLVTDPPYGVELHMEWRDDLMTAVAPAERSYMRQAYDRGKGRGRANASAAHASTTVSGDTRADWSEAYALVASLEVAYVWHADRFALPVGQGLEAIGFEHRQTIVWVKPYGVISRTHYNYQHEPCWYGVKHGATAKWVGDTLQTTVWGADWSKMMMGGAGEEKLDHPTQKPVELMRRAVGNHRGEVYEPFSGSGTTLIAAEQLDRRCYAMEIEPRYVGLAIERWQRFTGREAVRVA